MEEKPTSFRQLVTLPAAKPSSKPLRPAARIGDGTVRRGFASMAPALQRQLATKGGKASAASGRGHKWTAEQAREAGRKGGLISRRKPNKSAPSK